MAALWRRAQKRSRVAAAKAQPLAPPSAGHPLTASSTLPRWCLPGPPRTCSAPDGGAPRSTVKLTSNELPTRVLDGSEHAGRLAVVGMTIGGEPACVPRDSCHILVFGGPETRTMMQQCASAAKLRGGGPILCSGIGSHSYLRDPATSNRQSATRRKRANRTESVVSAKRCLLSMCGTKSDALGHHAIADEVPQGDQELAGQGDDHLLARTTGI